MDVGKLWKRTVAAVESKVDIDKALGKTRKVLEVGSEAADVLVELGNGLSIPGGVALAMRVAHTAADLRAQRPEEYFADEWEKFPFEDLETLLWRGLMETQGATVEEVAGLHRETPGVVIRLDGISFGWALSAPFKSPDCRPYRCWLPVATEKPGHVLSRIAWASVQGECAIVRTDKQTRELVIFTEPEKELFPSKRGDALYARVMRFHEHGHNRSVFVLGKPGVGKSCMLRYVASKMGGYCLRIKLSQMKDMNPQSLVDLVQLLRPNVLIIDDFDRFVEQGNHNGKTHNRDAEMLDPLEELNALVPLLMVSANFSENITTALLRPGRFDEIEVVDQVDPEIYAQLLPDAPENILKTLQRQKAPVTYVLELKKRVDALGYKDAAKEIRFLMARADVVIRLNKRRTSKSKSARGSLVGKTDRQKAALLDKRAVKADRDADRAATFVADKRLAAEENRKKAVKAREDAETKEKEAKEKRAKTKKKPKKKQTKAPTDKEESPRNQTRSGPHTVGKLVDQEGSA